MWVRKGALRWWRDWKPQRWADVGVALEQSTGPDGRKDSILFVYYTQYDEKKVGSAARANVRRTCPRDPDDPPEERFFFFVYFQYLQVFVNEVTALVPLLRDGHFAFGVYTPDRTRQRWPLILAAHAEQDVNDWVTADKSGPQS